MSQQNSITEMHKQRLAIYLMETVRQGLSGRDGDDIIGDPMRSIFSGVLQPINGSSISSLGLDLRVVPKSGTGSHIQLHIAPYWSHYYPVFPTWSEVLQANENVIAKSTFHMDEDEKVEEEDSIRHGHILSKDINPEEARDTQMNLSESNEKIVELPKVFRRYNVQPGIITVSLPLDQSNKVILGPETFSDEIRAAQASIRNDPSHWYHLGKPEHQVSHIPWSASTFDRSNYEVILGRYKKDSVIPPNWQVMIQVESFPEPSIPGALRVRVLLSNITPQYEDEPVDQSLEKRAIFDAGLSIHLERGEIKPFKFLLVPEDYRYKPEMAAKGINCSVKWSPEEPTKLATESIPIYKQPLQRTRGNSDTPFTELAETSCVDILEDIANTMDQYLADWDTFLEKEALRIYSEEERVSCQSDRMSFLQEIQGYRLGIETLKRDQKLRQAFQLMNKTFIRLSEKTDGKIKGWRLFQIGFIISHLPCLAARELGSEVNDDYGKALRTKAEEVGVLWFPTGGGKTEAYLGLIAIGLIYDRLRGKTRGVSTWLRFPLRMLSIQQLERMTLLIATLNELRSEEAAIASGDPFAIGYFAGNTVTPNQVNETDMSSFEKNSNMCEKVRIVRRCPFCGESTKIVPIRQQWRLAHICPNQSCFSNCEDSLGIYKGTLPIFIVDNEVYRYLPSIVVGTVDKLAIAGFNRHFVQMIRGANQKCPKHGYTSYDECIECWSSGCKDGKSSLQKLTPVKDPGLSLIVQDELHLLKAELGAFNSHYEGLLDYLGSITYMPATILAATATIEAYDTHAFHLYMKRASRFPQNGWEQGESFYATCQPEIHRRFYIGVLGHRRAIEDPVLAIIGLYHREIRRLIRNPQSAATIMQVEEMPLDSILDVLHLYDLSLTYVGRKATGSSLDDKTWRINNYLSYELLGDVSCAFLHGDLSGEDIGTVLDRIEAERKDTGEKRLDMLIATNLISHGVDLERINMMIACGMPSHYAEYVQCTSRAARSHPGIVFSVYKASDTRELSQYEFFEPIHEHMDRLIEAVAVNRFASFAPEKTVPGLLIGLLLCEHTPNLFRSQISKTLNYVPTLQIALGLKTGTESTVAGSVDITDLRSALERIIGVDQARPGVLPIQIENIRNKISEVLDDQIAIIGRTLENQITEALHPIKSFRDVDEGVDFGSMDSASIVSRL